MSSADHLRAMYQQSAAMFLATCANQMTDPNIKASKGCTSTATSTTKLSKKSFDPLAAANSLRLRSMYDTEIMASGIASNCIASSTAAEKSEIVNLIRSGGDKLSVPAEVGDIEASKSLQIYERQKKLLQDQKDAGMSIADATLQLAESIADNMFPGPSSSNMNSLVYAVRHDFHCKGCGNDLLPTPFSTVNGSAQLLSSKIRLKTLKRGKTRRRRASRQAAKKYTYDIHMLQKDKGGGRTFAQGNTNNMHGNGHGQSVASVMNTQEALKKNNAARRINDGMTKNCISYKCCGCGTEQSIKGMKRQRHVQGDEGAGARKVTNTSLVNTTASARTSSKQLSATRATSSFNNRKSLHASKVTTRFDTDDFLRLGAVPVPGQPQAQSQPTSIGTGIERKLKPLERPVSTKKRKAPVKKKSGLQNFLSSLND